MPGAKGEVAEMDRGLKALAQRPTRSPEAQQERRELFRKVVHYMSLGMDMSPVFSSMLANCASSDPQLKRLLYEYVSHYARSRPEMALLCVNTLEKDSADEDPTVRGLALRSLATLRHQEDFIEHVAAAVGRMLEDTHPYPRRCAVMGALKVHESSPEAEETRGLVNRCEELLARDEDPTVLANCAAVVEAVRGRRELAKRERLFPLLNRLERLSEWAQAMVLEAASGFEPAEEREAYDFLNAVDGFIESMNSAVALSAIKACLCVTKSMPAAHQQVYERVKAPLLTHCETAPCKEVAHTAFCHLAHLAKNAPSLFEEERDHLYPAASDDPATREVKAGCLAELCSPETAHEIASELSEWAAKGDLHTARCSVRALGRIAVRLPEAHGLLERLVEFVHSSHARIQDEAILSAVRAAQACPSGFPRSALPLADLAIEERPLPQARRSLAWLAGAFAGHLPDAPSRLWAAAQSFSEEEDGVKLELLTAGARCLLSMPCQEAKECFAEVVSHGFKDNSMDVRDRSAFLLKVLKHMGVERAAGVIGVGEACMGAPPDSAEEEAFTSLAAFNSLVCLLRRPAADILSRASPSEGGCDFHQEEAPPEAEESLLGGADSADEAPTQAESTSDPFADLLQ